MRTRRCQVTVKLDEKGRIALPARLRKDEDGGDVQGLVLTSYDGAIRAYSPEDFERCVEGPIRELDPFDPRSIELQHAFLACAEDCKVDSQGRMRIPEGLREEAGLRREVVLHTMLEFIELWDAERWQERRRHVLASRRTAR